MRIALAVVFLASVGCGKQLNPDFCDAHPADDRCVGGAIVDAAGNDDAQPADAMLIEGCPTDYDITVAGSTSRYRVIDTSTSWASAAMDCGDDQTTGPYTHLAILSNAAELEALATVMDRDRHVGHTDYQDEGTWVPLTTEPNVYPDIAALAVPPWASGEPNDSGDCAVLDGNLELRDRDCSNDNQAALCECDAFPHDL